MSVQQFASQTHTRTGDTAVVTGAASGIGRSIALRLAKDGYNLSLNDLPSKMDDLMDVEREIVGMGRKCLATSGDVSSEEDVIKLVEATARELSSVDVMIANAGICEHGSVVDMPTEVLDRIYAVNIRGVHLCYKHAARQMIKQGKGGRIIGASSMGGKKGQANTGAYVASKFAVRGLTQSAAVELGRYGITVNAYAPGVIDTPLATDFKSRSGFPSSWVDESPVGRMGTPEEVAGLVSYLVSSEAGFITGQSISINGGVYFD